MKFPSYYSPRPATFMTFHGSDEHCFTEVYGFLGKTSLLSIQTIAFSTRQTILRLEDRQSVHPQHVGHQQEHRSHHWPAQRINDAFYQLVRVSCFRLSATVHDGSHPANVSVIRSSMAKAKIKLVHCSLRWWLFYTRLLQHGLT